MAHDNFKTSSAARNNCECCLTTVICACVCVRLFVCLCVCGTVNVLFGMHTRLCNIKHTHSPLYVCQPSAAGRLSKCHSTEIHITFNCSHLSPCVSVCVCGTAAVEAASTTALTWNTSPPHHRRRIYLVVMYVHLFAFVRHYILVFGSAVAQLIVHSPCHCTHTHAYNLYRYQMVLRLP